MNGDQARQRLRETRRPGGRSSAPGRGTGLSAKCAEAGGVDLIIIYNSGRYRMAGRGSLAGLMPYGDANAIVLEMAGEVLPVVRHTPVLAGVCGTDPFRLMDRFLRQIEDARLRRGAELPDRRALIDGMFRANLEETGHGLRPGSRDDRAWPPSATCSPRPTCSTTPRPTAMTRAGADVLVPHMGLTTKGSIGAQPRPRWTTASTWSRRCATPRWRSTPTSSCSATAGRSPSPRTPQYVLDRTRGVVGFFGASSMERLPTEVAITENMRRFKAVRTGS